MAWRAPFGAMSAANWIAMNASNHFHRYGTTRAALGAIAINARRNAGLNPDAIYREPMTMDDYFAARMITSPFGLFDCDVPCDGSIALVVSAADVAPDLARPPVYVEAVGTQIIDRVSWDQGTLSHEPQTQGPAAHLWSRTSLRPEDVDFAQLYDGFTFNCLSWIEGLGLLRHRGGRRLPGRPGPDRARRPVAPQHLRRPALGRANARVRLSPRGGRPAARRRRGAPGGRAPRWASSAPVAERPAGASSSRRHAEAARRGHPTDVGSAVGGEVRRTNFQEPSSLTSVSSYLPDARDCWRADRRQDVHLDVGLQGGLVAVAVDDQVGGDVPRRAHRGGERLANSLERRRAPRPDSSPASSTPVSTKAAAKPSASPLSMAWL